VPALIPTNDGLQYAGYLHPEIEKQRTVRRGLYMATESRKQPKEPAKPASPCGSGCPDFVAKTCSGEDSKCALYWRFSQGFR
jgi:hypothetical protein